MKSFLYLLITFVLYSHSVLSNEIKSKQINYQSKDGITIYADFYQQPNTINADTIILFHQARGSARGEYSPIIPKLTANGFNVLAVDLRSGGDKFKASNRTVDSSTKKDYSYCQAYPDLVASLAYIKDSENSGPIYVWGSSYSAALVIKLAAEYPEDVSAFLAFSPASGKPMGDCSPNDLVDKLTVRGLIARPDKEMEYPSAKLQFELFKKHGFQMLVSENGLHGSSMLVEERTKHSTKKAWDVVLAFLGIENTNTKGDI